MSVVGVGWILFAQVYVVMVVVGVGGQAVVVRPMFPPSCSNLTVVKVGLHRLHILPTPPQAEPPRAPPPAVLSLDELRKIKTVCYIPDPDEEPSEPASPALTLVEPVDHSRLPFPAVQLKTHQSTCAICQESFLPPRASLAIMLKAEPLRLLGCSHVFHVGYRIRPSGPT